VNIRNFRFYKKEHEGKKRWWVDIKPWIFPKRLLIMYDSAEKWLEKIGNGSDEVIIAASTHRFPGSETLHRTTFTDFFCGAYYSAESYKQKRAGHTLLLCIVTVYVFGRYPKVIYYKVVH
jgi:hypothetical protein